MLTPYPLSPSPRAKRGRKGNFFCGILQAGVARLQNPLFFLPLPNGACAIGEGVGGKGKSYSSQRFIHRRRAT